MRSVRAFTLTELLMVVALVAILVGLLIPTVSSLRRSGVTTICLNNIRSLQVAHWLYMGENQWRFIDVGLAHGGAHADEEVAWVNTLEEHYGSELVLRSPADRSQHWPLDQGGQGVPIDGATDQFRRTSYGCNNFLCASVAPHIEPDEPFDRLSKIKLPAATVHFVMMAETGDFAGADHIHFHNWFVPGQPDQTPVQAASQLATSAHGGPELSWDARSNYGFLDGHAETLAFRQVCLDLEHNRFNPARAGAMMRLLGDN